MKLDGAPPETAMEVHEGVDRLVDQAKSLDEMLGILSARLGVVSDNSTPAPSPGDVHAYAMVSPLGNRLEAVRQEMYALRQRVEIMTARLAV